MCRNGVRITGCRGSSPAHVRARRDARRAFLPATSDRGPEMQSVLLPDAHMAGRSAEPILAPLDAALALVRP